MTFTIDESDESAYSSNSEAKPPMLSMAYSPTSTGANRFRFSPSAIRPGKGGNELNTKSFKIGPIAIKPLGKDAWQVRYHDPASGRDVRRRLLGITLRDVQAVASNINRELLTRGGFLPGTKPMLPNIGNALAEAIRLRNTIPATQKERAGRAMQFVKWLAENHPTVKTWDQLRPAIVQSYVVALERNGKAFDSVRLALAPIKLAWRYMAENYSEMIKPLPKIKLTRPPKREIECLNAAEVAALLDWLKVNAADIYAMAALAALAGLRQLEAAALRACDVDLSAGTVSINGDGIHKPKTRDSYRVLSLCSEALDAARGAMQNQRIVPTGGELFVNSEGEPWKREALSVRWTRTLRKASQALGKPRLAQIPAKGLRRSFATMASRLGVSDRLLKAYLGHSAGDMLGGHYRRIDMAELRTVSGAMEGWRTAFSQGNSGNILATSELQSDVKISNHAG